MSEDAIGGTDFQPEREDGLPILLEHELRCWSAEVENGRELASRIAVLLPASLGVLGLGCFRFGWVAELELPWSGEWIVRALGLGALALETRTLWLLLTLRQVLRRGGVPSRLLRLPQDGEEPLAYTRSRAMRMVYMKASAGTWSHSRQNSILRKRLDHAEAAFFLALVLLISGLGCYSILASGPRG